MPALVRVSSFLALAAFTLGAAGARADYDGASGYGAVTIVTHELDVSHDGYPSSDTSASDTPPATTEASAQPVRAFCATSPSSS